MRVPRGSLNQSLRKAWERRCGRECCERGSSGPGSAIQARCLPSPSPPIAHCYTRFCPFRDETPALPAPPPPRRPIASSQEGTARVRTPALGVDLRTTKSPKKGNGRPRQLGPQRPRA